MKIFNVFSQFLFLFATIIGWNIMTVEAHSQEVKRCHNTIIAPMAVHTTNYLVVEEPKIEETVTEEVAVEEAVVEEVEEYAVEETATTTEEAVVEETVTTVVEEVEATEESIEEEVLTSVPVLSNSSKKTYMSYTAITDETSQQWQYIHESGEITINEDGFLVTEDGYIGVALGSYFGEIGTKYQFVLDTGVTLKVVKVEEKSDEHTDENGFYQIYDGSVIEFVIDIDKIENSEYAECIVTGNFNSHEDFNGNIVEIYKVE